MENKYNYTRKKKERKMNNTNSHSSSVTQKEKKLTESFPCVRKQKSQY